MIKIEGGVLELSGNAGMLVGEATTIFHAVAQSLSSKIPDITYKDAIKHMLAELASLEKSPLITDMNKNNFNEQEEISFLQKVQDLKRKIKPEDLISLDEVRATKKKKKKKNFSIKGFMNDPRMQDDDFS